MITSIIIGVWAIAATIGMAIIADNGNNRLLASEAEAARIRKERDEARRQKEVHQKEASELKKKYVNLEAEYVNLQDAVSQADNAAGQWATELNQCELDRFKLTNEIAAALSVIPQEFKASDDLAKAVRTIVTHYSCEGSSK